MQERYSTTVTLNSTERNTLSHIRQKGITVIEVFRRGMNEYCRDFSEERPILHIHPAQSVEDYEPDKG